MNIHPRKREPDKSVMRDILRLLKPMQLEDFNQARGFLEFDADGEPLHEPHCLKCLGLTLAFHFSVNLGFDIDREFNDDGSSQMSYTEGEDLLNRATDVFGTELKHLMHQHGAPPDPFSSAPWGKRPYDVLQPLFSELLGEEIHA